MSTDDSSATETGASGHTGGSTPGGAHQGPGRWARRGAAGTGLPPGESGAGRGALEAPPTPDAGDPDISPSLAGGHAGATHAQDGRPGIAAND